MSTATERIRSKPGEPWEERFPRYAHNAGITATLSESYAARQRRNAMMHDSAAATPATTAHSWR